MAASPPSNVAKAMEQIRRAKENSKNIYPKVQIITEEVANAHFPHIYKIKVCLIGETDVGKSTIFKALAENSLNGFYEKQSTTIGVDHAPVNFVIDNDKILKMGMYDTAGQERFRAVVHGYIREAYYIMCVFDTTEDRSLDVLLAHWIPWINENYSSNQKKPKLVMIANKIDLKSDYADKKTRFRQELADKAGCPLGELLYFEVSAKEGTNMVKMFGALISCWMNENSAKLEDPATFAPKKQETPPLAIHAMDTPTPFSTVAYTPYSNCGC